MDIDEEACCQFIILLNPQVSFCTYIVAHTWEDWPQTFDSRRPQMSTFLCHRWISLLLSPGTSRVLCCFALKDLSTWPWRETGWVATITSSLLIIWSDLQSKALAEVPLTARLPSQADSNDIRIDISENYPKITEYVKVRQILGFSDFHATPAINLAAAGINVGLVGVGKEEHRVLDQPKLISLSSIRQPLDGQPSHLQWYDLATNCEDRIWIWHLTIGHSRTHMAYFTPRPRRSWSSPPKISAGRRYLSLFNWDSRGQWKLTYMTPRCLAASWVSGGNLRRTTAGVSIYVHLTRWV